VVPCLGQPINTLEQAVSQRLQHTPAYEQLLTVAGMGTIVAPPIVLDTGDSGRCSPVGHDTASCRWVRSTQIRNGKRQGQGHGNNGHPSLAWASREAAQLASRCSPPVPRLYQRQQRQSHLRIARKAVAHTLARAGYDLMRDLVSFEVHTACG
jgi:transposase